MADWDPLVNEIFLRAIEAGSPAGRAEILDRSCRDEPELRRKVEALLSSGSSRTAWSPRRGREAKQGARGST